MRIHGRLRIGHRQFNKGDDLPWLQIYPFFLLHMLIFGLSGFVMAYSQFQPPLLFLYAHGGIAIFVYIIFYLTIFGREEVKWMFINAVLASLAIYSQIDWLLSLFGKEVGDYPFYVHLIPFLYFVLYTFLMRQALIDLAGARENGLRRQIVDNLYVIGSLVVCLAGWLSQR